MKRILISMGLLLSLFARQGSSADSPLMLAGLAGPVSVALDKALGLKAANDYLCGSVILSLSPGWTLSEVEIFQGSIQNRFQFIKKRLNKQKYKPHSLSTKILHVKQTTGYFQVSGLSPISSAIDFTATLQDPLGLEYVFHVEKGTCNKSQTGDVKVEQLAGNELYIIIQDSVRDLNTSWTHEYSSAFFTPAYVVIPGPGYEE